MSKLESVFLHRQNNLLQIEDDGIEIDIRSSFRGLVLNHDRLNHSEQYPLLKDKIHLFKDKKIILNIKESGVEEELIEMMGDLDYYFLDSQIPDILKISKNFTNVKSRFIIRLSDVEDLNTEFLSIVNPKYLWLDYSKFSSFDVSYYFEFFERVFFKAKKRKIILVSPELYSLEYAVHIPEVFNVANLFLDKFSVCTKSPQVWRNLDDQSKQFD